jgi:hypothetical protein
MVSALFVCALFFSFFVFCSCEYFENDPNFVQEYKRVLNANLSAIVTVDGDPECYIFNGIVEVLIQLKIKTILVFDGTSRDFTKECFLSNQIFKDTHVSKTPNLIVSDILVSLSTYPLPVVSSTMGKLCRIYLFQHLFSLTPNYKHSYLQLRGYDHVLYLETNKFSQFGIYAGNISQDPSSLKNDIPITLIPQVHELSFKTELKDSLRFLRNLIMEGLLANPFSVFIRWNLPLLRSRKIPNFHERANVALIIEPRQHPHLEFVVRNVLLHLNYNSNGTFWRLQFHFAPGPDGNEQFVKSALHDIPGVTYMSLKKTFRSSDDYNTILKDAKLWESLQLSGANRVLVFQVDSMLVGTDITPFLSYDFIGAPWHTTANAQSSEWIRKDITSKRGGSYYEACCNGGLSLRSTDAMVKITRKLRSLNPKVNEDTYFSRSSKSMGFNLPKRKVAYLFSREIECDDLSDIKHNPFGLHNAWMYMDTGKVWDLFHASMQSIGMKLIPAKDF